MTCVEMGIDRALTVDGVGGGGVANYEEEGLLVSVTAVNLAGLRSGTVRSRVYFLTEPPETTGQYYQYTYVYYVLYNYSDGGREGGKGGRCFLSLPIRDTFLNV